MKCSCHRHHTQSYDVSLDGLDDLVDAFPVVGVFGLSVDYLEALEDVYDVVDASALHGQLPSALVQVQQALRLAPVQTQESPTQLPQALLLPAVLELRLHRLPRSRGIFVFFSEFEGDEASLDGGDLGGPLAACTGYQEGGAYLGCSEWLFFSGG